MRSDENDPLEIDRSLKALPDLTAPGTLVSRVMTVIRERSALPWYRRAWTTWAEPWRSVFLGWLVVCFGAACFGAWFGLQTLVASPRLAKGQSAVEQTLATWGAFLTVFDALRSVLGQLPPAFYLGCVAAALFGYTVCLALGTTFFRAVVSRSINHR